VATDCSTGFPFSGGKFWLPSPLVPKTKFKIQSFVSFYRRNNDEIKQLMMRSMHLIHRIMWTWYGIHVIQRLILTKLICAQLMQMLTQLDLQTQAKRKFKRRKKHDSQITCKLKILCGLREKNKKRRRRKRIKRNITWGPRKKKWDTKNMPWVLPYYHL